MELCDGFAWPVPVAFRDALRICRFRQGDLLYTDPVAYEDWSSARCKAIQVLSATGDSEEGEDAFQLFQTNWSAGCRVKILDLNTRAKTEHSTTHGRLFTALWRGDLGALEGDSTSPPFGTRECLQRLREATEPPSSGAEYRLVVDWTLQLALNRERAVLHAVEDIEGVEVSTTLPADLGIDGASPLLRILQVTYSGGKIEAFRDALKMALWPRPTGLKPTIAIGGKSKPRTLDSYMEKTSSTGKSVPSISDFGVFVRKLKKPKDIVSVSFMHGAPVPYYFRFNPSIISEAKVPNSVVGYIQSMVADCPTHVFKEFPNTSHDGCNGSDIGERLKVEKIEHRELLGLARDSFDEDSCKGRHGNLEKWFVTNDPQTLAVELPVWMRSDELVEFEDTFGCRRGMAGHIDLVRLEDGRVWIWDYKPKAKKEKRAHVQVFLYVVMFALRTGVPMNRLGAGYFDESDVFEVRW